MANRVIRDWTDSEKMNNLSFQAEVLFTRLMMKADDYGNYHANPKLINSFCFPLKNIRETDIIRWLQELASADLIAHYNADNKPYLHIRNFGQRLRQMKPKFPQMSEIEHDKKMSASCQQVAVNRPLETETETIYNTLFEIQDFNLFLKSFHLNKSYCFIAYKFWEVWKNEFPNQKHLKTAKMMDWYDTVRKIIEVDKQTIDRLIAIYIFFTKCQEKQKGYHSFLFSQVKSLPALRKATDSGEYRIDNLAAVVNEKLEKDDDFNSEVRKAIENFKSKFKQ